MRLRGTELSLWIGGMKDTQTAVFNGPIHKSTAPLGIAWQADPNAPGWFSGTIDEVRVSRFARGAFGNPTLTYDDNGNLASDGDLKFSYDFLNRLVRVRRAADDSVLAEYAYDALGRRVLRVDHSPLTTHLTRYIYDTYDVIAEYDGSDALQAQYILGRRIDEPLAMERRDVADVDGDNDKTEFQTFYYHTNHLGTVAALTWWDSVAGQEKLVEDYSYDAYGFVSVVFHAPSSLVPGPSSRVGNPYLFTARALDPETGLYYFRARYYSTTLGRFISRDPLGYVDGMNLYCYAHDSPVNHIDPTGQCWIPAVIGGLVGGVMGWYTAGENGVVAGVLGGVIGGIIAGAGAPAIGGAVSGMVSTAVGQWLRGDELMSVGSVSEVLVAGAVGGAIGVAGGLIGGATSTAGQIARGTAIGLSASLSKGAAVAVVRGACKISEVINNQVSDRAGDLEEQLDNMNK